MNPHQLPRSLIMVGENFSHVDAWMKYFIAWSIGIDGGDREGVLMLKQLQSQTRAEIDALLPSVLLRSSV